MTEYQQIKGKIAKIQDKYRVIINKGAEEGVIKDMKFYAYEEGEKILDPDTEKVIEIEEILKAYLKVIHVQDNIAILESDETETVVKKVPGIIDNFARNRLYPSTIKRNVMKPLNVSIDNDSEVDSIIKKGTSVKSMKPKNET